jgi:hypothetical protein
MEDLRAAADGFHLDAVAHDSVYEFTSSRDTEATEQGINAVTLRSKVRPETNYALTNESAHVAGRRVDLAVPKGPDRRGLGCAGPPAPLAEGTHEKGEHAR